MRNSARFLWKTGSRCYSFQCMRATAWTRNRRWRTGDTSEGPYPRRGTSGCYRLRIVSSGRWRISLGKSLLQPKKRPNSFRFSERSCVASPFLVVVCGGESVSERRFPASHSSASIRRRHAVSVSERRFPASHSVHHQRPALASSVSERRFPASHSHRKPLRQNPLSVSERRFPASHSGCRQWQLRRRSVSERRFPASHSGPTAGNTGGASVSERRFPASHSDRVAMPVSPRRRPNRTDTVRHRHRHPKRGTCEEDRERSAAKKHGRSPRPEGFLQHPPIDGCRVMGITLAATSCRFAGCDDASRPACCATPLARREMQRARFESLGKPAGW